MVVVCTWESKVNLLHSVDHVMPHFFGNFHTVTPVWSEMPSGSVAGSAARQAVYVVIKLRNFWQYDLEVWCQHVEVHFQLWGITVDDTKDYHEIAALASSTTLWASWEIHRRWVNMWPLKLNFCTGQGAYRVFVVPQWLWWPHTIQVNGERAGPSRSQRYLNTVDPSSCPRCAQPSPATHWCGRMTTGTWQRKQNGFWCPFSTHAWHPSFGVPALTDRVMVMGIVLRSNSPWATTYGH